MATSSSYWTLAESVRDELVDICAEAKDMHGILESNDDPGQLAELLADLQKRVDKVSAQIAPAIPTLKKTAAALDSIPQFKRS